MEVKILNPEVLQNLYKNHGEFACVCYDTPDKYAAGVGKSCEESGHMSGSRCEYIKFRVTGLDRGTSEQCLRHEIGVSVPYEYQDNWYISDFMTQIVNVNPSAITKNMASFRYIDKEGFKYSTPKNIENCEAANALYKTLMENVDSARGLIVKALENDGHSHHQAVEDANYVLPRATETSFTIGFTPEAFIHFCHKRLCTRAQDFIQQLAKKMKKECAKYNEKFAEELVPHCKYLMWCPEGKHSCGVAPTRAQLKEFIDKYKVEFNAFLKESGS